MADGRTIYHSERSFAGIHERFSSVHLHTGTMGAPDPSAPQAASGFDPTSHADFGAATHLGVGGGTHVVAPHSSVVQCLWGVFVWGFGVLFLSCVCVCRGCCSLSMCVCVFDLLIFLHGDDTCGEGRDRSQIRRIYRRGFTEFTREVISALGYLPVWGNSKFYLRVKSLPGVNPKFPFSPTG